MTKTYFVFDFDREEVRLVDIEGPNSDSISVSRNKFPKFLDFESTFNYDTDSGQVTLTRSEALRQLEHLARNLATYRGMVSGYLSIMMGAGNPEYFYEIVYQQDGYDSTGFAKTSGGLTAHGPTLETAVQRLLEL